MKIILLLLSLASFAAAQNVTISSGSTPIDIGGNSGSSNRLKTARNINGVPFDGTNDITISAGSDSNQAARDAIAVTLLRPSKLKWKLGNFGTFTPSERIYVRIANLMRMPGAPSTIYAGGLFTRRGLPIDFQVVASGQTVTAHGSFSVLCYVTETDVAAVSNPTQTLARMLAYVDRTATPRYFSAEAVSGKSSTPPSGSTNPTSITPGTYGSLVVWMEGEGYEGDLVPTVSSTSYVAPSMAPKAAITTNSATNDWGHQWWGVVPLYCPIASSMDSQSFSWAIKVYSGAVTYNGLINAQVVDLPSDWDTDVSG